MGIIEQQRTTGAGYDNTNAIAGPSLWRYSRGGLGGAMYALQLGVKAIAGVKYGVTNSSLEKQRSYYAALRINLAQIALKVARWLEENAPEYLQKK